MTLPEILPVDDPRAVAKALALLSDGRPVAMPTDTVYGVAAPAERAVVQRLFELKQRPQEKPIPLLLADAALLNRYVPSVPSLADVLTTHLWPGAVTLVLRAVPEIAEMLGSRDGSVGFRVPDHNGARLLIESAGGALAVTSANPSGESECNSAQEVLDRMGGAVELILDGGPTPGTASTVLRVTEGSYEILRSGPLDAEVTQLIELVRG